MNAYKLHAWPFTAFVSPNRTNDLVHIRVDLYANSPDRQEIIEYNMPKDTAHESAVNEIYHQWRKYFENALTWRTGKRDRVSKREHAEISAKLAAPFTYERRETFTL